MSNRGKIKSKVGRRRTLKGTDVSCGRLVIATVSDNEVEAVDHIMDEYGHNARSGAIRFALRLLARAHRGNQDVETIASQVRRESCGGKRPSERHRVPVNLSPDDSDILEDLKDRWELDSFAQVVRVALRYSDID